MVYENRGLRRIFWPWKDKVTGEWRRLHNEDFNDLYCLPNVIWVIKSKGMRGGWAHSTYGREERCIQGFGGET